MLVHEELVLSLNPLVGDRAFFGTDKYYAVGGKCKKPCDVLF